MDAVIDRMLPDAAKEIILQKLQHYRPSIFGIEDNGFQELFMNDIRDEAARRRIYGTIEGVHNSANKEGRIQGLQPLTKTPPGRQAIVNFFFGSSIGSKQKSEQIKGMKQ